MLLLHVSVESGIAKIRLVAVLTLKIAAVNVILRSTLVLVSIALRTALIARTILIL